MASGAWLTIELDPELREQLERAAASAESSPAQIVHGLIQDHFGRASTDRKYDEWFRREVEAGLRELDDPSVRLVPNEEVMAQLRAEQEVLRRLVGDERL